MINNIINVLYNVFSVKLRVAPLLLIRFTYHKKIALRQIEVLLCKYFFCSLPYIIYSLFY